MPDASEYRNGRATHTSTQKHRRATEFIGHRTTSTAMGESRQSLKNLAASRVNIGLSE
jgi:hypothetical protein